MKTLRRFGRALLLSAWVPAAIAGCGSDGQSAMMSPLPVPPGPYARPAYTSLLETGLYSDPSALVTDPKVSAFEPTYRLWSDGATKRRFVKLPPGTQIDTTDMDHWVFPIGTKFWKEFSLNGVLLETRLVERYGDGPDDYWMGAFVWNAAQTDAVFAIDGQDDINGTMHDAPSQEKCGACHRGDVGRVLGFSELQLSRPAGGPQVGPTLADLAAANWLTSVPVPPPGAAFPDPGVPFTVPGDATAVAALGYLHANCGHCHNPNGTSWPDTQMVLRLSTTDLDVASTAVYQSLVNQPLQYWRGGAIKVRVSPGVPDASAIVVRMSTRGTDDQMPPLATELVDPDGIAAVRAWVASLAPATP